MTPSDPAGKAPADGAPPASSDPSDPADETEFDWSDGRGRAAGGIPDELLDMLYAGERLVDGTPVGSAHVAVTTHRVLALTPDGDGPRFQAIHRPNVDGASVVSSGDGRTAWRAARAGLYAAVLLGAGVLLDLGRLVRPVEVPPGTGIGGVVTLVNALIRAVALLDELLLVLGLGAAAAALGLAGWYLRGRERYLEIGDAGGDPIRIPVRRDRTAAAGRIEEAVEGAESDERA